MPLSVKASASRADRDVFVGEISLRGPIKADLTYRFDNPLRDGQSSLPALTVSQGDRTVLEIKDFGCLEPGNVSPTDVALLAAVSDSIFASIDELDAMEPSSSFTHKQNLLGVQRTAQRVLIETKGSKVEVERSLAIESFPEALAGLRKILRQE